MHPRSPIRYYPKYRSIRHGKTVLHGITKVLRQCFYPKYSFYAAKTDHSTEEEADNKSDKYKHIKGSARLGRGFDGAVGSVLKLMKKHSFLKPDSFLDPKRHVTQYLSKLTKTETATIHRLSKRRNPYLKLFLVWLKGKNYRLVDTQTPVGHPGLKIGTMVDAVIHDGERFRPVEFKTGFESYHMKATKHPMRFPFHDQPDHPLNQHHLQLAVTTALYQYTFPQLKVGKPILLRFQTSGIDEYKQPKFITKERIQDVQKILAKRSAA